MKKKLLAVILTAAMAFSLAACGDKPDNNGGSQQEENKGGEDEKDPAGEETPNGEATAIPLDGSWPEETVKIGIEWFDTTADSAITIQTYFDYLSEHFNLEFIQSEAIPNAEAETDFINQCAAAGCKAIMGYYNVGGADAMKLAMDQGMYYWGTEQFYDEFADNPLYLGTYTLPTGEGIEGNGDYLAGYDMAMELAKQGVKHIFYCNGGASFGIQMFIDRQAGFEAGIKAAQAEGMDIQYDPAKDVIEGFPDAPDFPAALQAKLDGTYDGAAVSCPVVALLTPIADAGLADKMKLATVGAVGDECYEGVQSGLISCIVYECEEVQFGNIIVQILNAVSGHNEAYQTADGKAGKIDTHRWNVTDAETYEAIYNYHNDGKYFVTAEDIAALLAENVEGVTFDDVNAFYGGMTVDKAAEITSK